MIVYRFSKDGLVRLHDVLDFPSEIVCDNNSKVDSFQALLLSLCRLRYNLRIHEHAQCLYTPTIVPCSVGSYLRS